MGSPASIQAKYRYKVGTRVNSPAGIGTIVSRTTTPFRKVEKYWVQIDGVDHVHQPGFPVDEISELT